MSKQTLTITDNRTGQTIELPIEHDTIPAIGLRQLKAQADDFGMMVYDPGYTNTASCKSRVTFVDGDRGILRYRGYPIEQLAEESTFLEVAYLLLFGELPAATELTDWNARVMAETQIDRSLKDLLKTFGADAHPMGVLISAVAAMSALYPDSKQVHDSENRMRQVLRILGQLPTAIASAYRHRLGRPHIDPDDTLSYSDNFLHMMGLSGDGEVDPVLARAMDVLFILHADHEQNCSTSALRNIASSDADPYCAVAGAVGALYGPLHGGANEAVLRMLAEIGDTKNIPAFLDRVKGREVRLMGFGHRVYKNYDPRAQIVKRIAYEVFDVTGSNRLIDIAVELEGAALEDDYFVSRRLYPNVDFYSGIIYQAMGFPVEIFPVLFALGRAPGWLAQWMELMNDEEQRIARPRQIYLGETERPYVSLNERG
ncbi:MAG: citrate synthase [Caldilineaceae bacterium SB0661_bin_32]|uniref:Citrate synthase n=1 Tax=Caldilineaceae bacterium SB0661_bin_32 TaxID=2605255 RepID=A0A6B1DBJ8_9CHLR|nr:citrate synthase [Caldilineaceae bacterium SB0661_bin_32]